MKQPRVLFLTLACFSLTGGIEKVCSALSKALALEIESSSLAVYSLVDAPADLDSNYIVASQFRGFSRQKLNFVWSSFRKSMQKDILILSHVHLLAVAKLVKWFRPQTRIILLAHGIEIWRPLASWKGKFLKQIEIWAVSKHTKTQLLNQYGLNPEQIHIQHNCLDPFFQAPAHFDRPNDLVERYQIQADEKVIFSLCRLASQEAYKGYDQVIQTLPNLIKRYPKLRYLIGGKADAVEKDRIQRLIDTLKLTEHVSLIGYVADQEVQDHFKLADVFAMPSHEEGFGIVFIESAACGCLPLAGNRDGSVDALLNGALGELVDPLNLEDIEMGLGNALANTQTTEQKRQRQTLCLEHFAFEQYQKKVITQLNRHTRVDANLTN